MSSVDIDPLSKVAERQYAWMKLLKLKSFEEKQKRITELQKSKESINMAINTLLHRTNGLSDLVKNGILIIHLPSISSLFESMRYEIDAYAAHQELFDILIDKDSFAKKGYNVELRESISFGYKYHPCLIITTNEVKLYKWKLWFYDFSENCIKK